MANALIVRAARSAAGILLLHLLAPSVALAHPGHGEHLSRGQAIALLAGSALVIVGMLLLGARGLSRGWWRWVPVGLLGLGFFTSSVGVLAFPLLQGPCRGRPATAARLEVRRPQDGGTLRSPVPVEVAIVGGRLAPAGALANRPDEGHLHISVDGQLVSMIGQQDQAIHVPLGRHRITVEFVANDHAVFCPPVSATHQVNVTQ